MPVILAIAVLNFGVCMILRHRIDTLTNYAILSENDDDDDDDDDDEWE